jgi:nucleotide-binding universal stress UspA family protein
VARALFRRHHGDPQPEEPCTVLLAGLGKPFSSAAVGRAAELARQADTALDTPIAVLTIAKVHGSSFGVQHPGLLPTKKERDAQVQLVDDAINRLRRLGVHADGQVAVTRKFLRTILSVASARDARFVVMDDPGGGPLRRWFEGDPARYIRPRLPEGVVIEIVAPVATSA